FQPFDRDVSPLARLLDWLAWKYRLLFVVSAGNHADSIEVSVSREAWRGLDGEEQRSQVLQALAAGQVVRRPLSPAEAINAVTVGAIHADHSTPIATDPRVDPLAGARLPSPVSTVASGFRRSVKPDILLPGGRQFYRERPGSVGDPAVFDISDTNGPPG